MTNLISIDELPAIMEDRKEELSNVLFERLLISIDSEENFTIVFDE